MKGTGKLLKYHNAMNLNESSKKNACHPRLKEFESKN
jgi:hypothetical protein